jgi:hypothetical protein
VFPPLFDTAKDALRGASADPGTLVKWSGTSKRVCEVRYSKGVRDVRT